MAWVVEAVIAMAIYVAETVIVMMIHVVEMVTQLDEMIQLVEREPISSKMAGQLCWTC
jgi:hypothetical protein